MRIGSTPTHRFTLPFDEESISALEITYCQNRRVVLRKNERECVIKGNTVEVKLSQEETFEFTADVNVEIQIRVVSSNGEVFPSDIFTVSCKRCLSDEVL